MSSAEDIYSALTRGRKEWKNIRDMCRKHEDGPFRKISRSKDSVLQKALYSGDVDLVLQLLHDAKDRYLEPHRLEVKLIDDVNSRKNTILHMAATHDSCISAARKICEYAEQLIFTKNDIGEFPIFSAVRYGQMKMFKFLNSKIIQRVPDEEFRTSFYTVSDEREITYTILHVAIYNEHFELALYIATTMRSLISEKDHHQMTGLHMLAMNSSAFRNNYWKWQKLLLPSETSIGNDSSCEDERAETDFTMTSPYWYKLKKEYRRYQAALKLGAFLVENDTEWIEKLESTDVDDADALPADINFGSTYGENLTDIEVSYVDEGSMKSPKPKPPTPLILATKFGCVEIALQIIKKHPQTVEQVDKEYGSILHLAIKYRRIEIFEAVVKMKMQMRRLVRLQDKDENSILHMVALNTTKVKAKNGTDDSILQKVALITKKVEDKIKSVSDATSTKTLTDATSTKTQTAKRRPWDAEELNHESRSPAFILQDDLVLFERVEDILKTHYHKIPNKDLETADQLFAAKKEPLREEAQEWMKRTAENCSLVAILIATVAFAAAYTVPGGTDDTDGYPRLLDQTFFMVFTVADVLSLASTLTAVVVFLSILCSSYRLEDFKVMLPRSLMFGILCLIFSLTMMMLAFAATIILMIKNRQNWTKIALYAVAFLPVSVLVSTYLPFYLPLMQTVYYTIDKVKKILPEFDDRKKEKMITWFNRLKSSVSKNKELIPNFA